MLVSSFDTETSGLDLRHLSKPFLAGFFRSDSDAPLFWEWDVDPYTRRVGVSSQDLDAIEGQLEEADVIVGQNLKYDITALHVCGRKWRPDWWKKIRDTTFSGHLLNTDLATNLTDQALVYLGVDILPYEERVEHATKKCRTLVAKKDFIKEHGQWATAKEDMPGLPSAKGKKIWKNDMWLPREVAKALKLPANHKWWTVTSDYANTDFVITLKLDEVHQQLMQDRNLLKMYEERLKLIRVLSLMEERGITYSAKRLGEMIERFNRESVDLAKECVKLSDGLLEGLPKQGTTNAMRHLLFKRWKLPVVARSEDTGEPSLDADAIKEYLFTLNPNSKQHKFIENLSEYRTRCTAVGYADGYERFSRPYGKSKEYRKLHASINPNGARTLRFTHSMPNQSNVSQKERANLRKAFGPAEGREWWSLDYANLELRLPAYKSNQREMIELFERPNDPPYFGSYHMLNASIIYEDEFKACLLKSPNEPLFNQSEGKGGYKSTLYTYTKQFGFGIQYGAQEDTADKAAKKPGSFNKVKSVLSKISALNESQVEHAQKHGYIWTMEDSRIGTGYPVVVRKNNGRVKPTQPFSYYIQSTGMWVMIVAMIRCQDQLDEWNAEIPPHLQSSLGYFMAIQVHDELVFDFPKSKKPLGNLPRVRRLQSIMEESGDFIGIPLKADCKYHPDNWGESSFGS